MLNTFFLHVNCDNCLLFSKVLKSYFNQVTKNVINADIKTVKVLKKSAVDFTAITQLMFPQLLKSKTNLLLTVSIVFR